MLERYGANPPIILGYRDQEVKEADPKELTGKVLRGDGRGDSRTSSSPSGRSAFRATTTTLRCTGPLSLPSSATAPTSDKPARLFYVALSQEFMDDGELDLEGPEVDPTHRVDIADTKAVKLAALRSYASQEDAQQLAAMFEERAIAAEWFHQAIPPPDRSNGVVEGFW